MPVAGDRLTDPVVDNPEHLPVSGFYAIDRPRFGIRYDFA